MVMSKDKKRGRKPDPNSKRSLGVPRHTQPRKAFHGPAELFAAFERCISDMKPAPAESAALRLALEEFLEKRGYWPPKESK